jgi:hypothetical protein
MTTYYVDGAVGNDANAGTSEGAGNAWATIDKAMNTVASGDKVWVKATGTYSEDPVIDTAAATAATIVFEGYSSTTGDNGKVTISGTTNSLGTTLGPGESRYVIKNFIFNGGSGAAVSLGAARANTFINCEFTGASTDGFEGTGANNTFINCEFTSNTQHGIDATSISGGYIVGCIFHSNGRTGLQIGSTGAFYRNLVYNNDTAAAGWNHGDLGTTAVVIGNTFDGENRSGQLCDINGQSIFIAVDNVFYDSGTYGLTNPATTSHYRAFAGYNLLNDNASGTYADAGDPELIGYQDVTTAPAFTSESTDDYTLGASSPAIDAGMQPGGIT